MGRSQAIDDGQQQDRKVVVACLQAIEVGGDDDDGFHERGVSRFLVVELVMFELIAQGQHFPGDHHRAVEYQRFESQVQEPGGCFFNRLRTRFRVAGNIFQLQAHHFEALVEIRPYPAQRGA